MYCPKCGKELMPDARFCTECGSDVHKTISDLNAKDSGLDAREVSPVKAAATAEHRNITTETHLTGVLYWLLIPGIIVCMVFILNMELVQAIAWVVIGLLVWLFIKPYVVIGHLDKKNQAGIQTNLTQNQIIALLEENPWCDDQIVRIDDSEIPKSQHRAQIYFRGIRSQVYFFIEDGILHAYGSSAVKIQKFRRLYLAYKETANILQYIATLENGGTAAARRVKQKNSIGIKMRSWYDTFNQLCWLIAVVLAIGLVIYSSQNHPIRDLQDIVFDEYGTLTLGDAVKANVRNAEWEQEKISKTHYKVTLSGFLPEEYANISLMFDVNYANDYVYAHTDTVIWNGDYSDNHYDINYTLNSIYGNQQ